MRHNGPPFVAVPNFLVKVKLSDTKPSPSCKKFANLISCKRGLQLVNAPEWTLHHFGNSKTLVADAAQASTHFV